jgi:hypothetical protein
VDNADAQPAATADCTTMDLAIRPDDLYAASVALAQCGAELDAAALTFAQRGQADLPDLGSNAATATTRAIVEAEHGVQTISSDIARLAHALAGLAHHYPRVDGTAVSRR